MRVFENRVLRRIFGPKRGKETEGWRKIHNEELNNVCFFVFGVTAPSGTGPPHSLGF